MHPRLHGFRFVNCVRCLSSALPAGPHFRGAHISVHATIISHVFQLELNRPSHRNALSREVVEELEASVSMLRRHPPRALIVRSTDPRAFCAGADLKERKTLTESAARAITLRLRETLSLLAVLPTPTIALVEGPARGGGAELALACDIRVFGPEGSLALPETKLGIIPGAGGTQRLPRLVGMARALDIMWSGRTVGAAEAMDIGLAQFGPAKGVSVGERAMQVAEGFAKSAPGAVRLVKEAVRRGMEQSILKGLDVEWECYEQTFGTKEREEGIKAFSEKRDASF